MVECNIQNKPEKPSTDAPSTTPLCNSPLTISIQDLTPITPQPNFILDSGSSPRIGGGDELLVAHIELTYWRGCKIYGGDEVEWALGR